MSTQITAQFDPFSKARKISFDAGKSLYDTYNIIRKSDFREFPMVYYVNGMKEINIDYIIKDNDKIVMTPDIEGTDGAKLAGGGALIAAGLGLGALALMGAGGVFILGPLAISGAWLLGAGALASIGAGGFLASSVLTGEVDVDTDSTPFLSGASNSVNQGGSVPYIMGEHLYTPTLLCNPFTSVVNGDQYLNLAFICGQNDSLITQMSIGDVLAWESGDSSIGTGAYDIDFNDYRGLGTALPSPYDILKKQATVGLTIGDTEDEDNVAYTTTYTGLNDGVTGDKVIIGVSFPNGIYYNNGSSIGYGGSPIAVYMSSVEADSLQGVPTPLHEDIMSYPEDEYVSNSNDYPYYSFIYAKSTNAFYFEIVIDIDEWIAYSGDESDSGQYQIQLYKIEKTNDDYIDDCTFAYLTSQYSNVTPIDLTLQGKLHVATLVIKSATLDSTSAGEVSMLMHGQAAKLSGGTWGSKAYTQNPAAWFADIIKHSDFNKKPITDDELDLDSLEDFQDYCDTTQGSYGTSFKCNGVISSAESLYTILNEILYYNRASFGRDDSGKYKITVDAESSDTDSLSPYSLTVKQIFTNRNSWDFVGSRVYSDFPTRLDISYINEDADYIVDTQSVYYDNTNPDDSNIREISVPYKTTQTDVYKYGKYLMNSIYIRSELFTITCDPEGLVVSRGDRVKLAYDIPLIGLVGARIKSYTDDGTYITTVTFDDTVVIDSTTSYAMEVRSASSVTTYNLDTPTASGEYNTFTLTSTIAIGAFDISDLVIFGEQGSISEECLITNISYDSSYNATVSLVKYDADIYNMEWDSVPTFSTNITVPGDFDLDVTIDRYYNPEVDLSEALFSTYYNAATKEVRYATEYDSDLGSKITALYPCKRIVDSDIAYDASGNSNHLTLDGGAFGKQNSSVYGTIYPLLGASASTTLPSDTQQTIATIGFDEWWSQYIAVLYDFRNDDGTDFGVGGHDLTENGSPTYGADPWGLRAVTFDGTSDYLQADAWFAPGTESFTIGFWLKNNDKSSVSYIVTQQSGSASAGFYVKTDVTGTISARVSDGSTGVTGDVIDQSNYNENQWNYISVVFNLNSLEIIGFINGVEKATVTIPAGIGSISAVGSFRLGSNAYSASAFLDGSLSNVRIVESALSADDVANSYALETGATQRTEETKILGPADGNHSAAFHGGVYNNLTTRQDLKGGSWTGAALINYANENFKSYALYEFPLTGSVLSDYTTLAFATARKTMQGVWKRTDTAITCGDVYMYNSTDDTWTAQATVNLDTLEIYNSSTYPWDNVKVWQEDECIFFWATVDDSLTTKSYRFYFTFNRSVSQTGSIYAGVPLWHSENAILPFNTNSTVGTAHNEAGIPFYPRDGMVHTLKIRSGDYRNDVTVMPGSWYKDATGDDRWYLRFNLQTTGLLSVSMFFSYDNIDTFTDYTTSSLFVPEEYAHDWLKIQAVVSIESADSAKLYIYYGYNPYTETYVGVIEITEWDTYNAGSQNWSILESENFNIGYRGFTSETFIGDIMSYEISHPDDPTYYFKREWFDYDYVEENSLFNGVPSMRLVRSYKDFKIASTIGYATDNVTNYYNTDSSNSYVALTQDFDDSGSSILDSMVSGDGVTFVQTLAVNTLFADTLMTQDLQITDGGQIRMSKSSYSDSTAGFWLGDDSGTAKFVIGDASNSLTWDGSSLIIEGTITAGSGSVIGGWTIETSTIASDNNKIVLDSGTVSGYPKVTVFDGAGTDVNANLKATLGYLGDITGFDTGAYGLYIAAGNECVIEGGATFTGENDGTNPALYIIDYDGAYTIQNSSSVEIGRFGSLDGTIFTAGDIGLQVIGSNGRFFVGSETGNYIKWTGTALEVTGSISISNVSSVLTELNVASGADVTADNTAAAISGQGDLATQDTVAWSTDITSIPSTLETPSGAGLYLGSTYLGYYDSSAWKTYMDSSGHFYLGGTSGKLQWDGSNLSIEGNITLTNTISASDISDVASGADVTADNAQSVSWLTDAGDLATQDTVAWSTDITSIPSTLGTPSGAGLYLSSTYLGYYDSSAWKTYMDSSGNFYLGGTSGSLQWNGTDLTIEGAITATSGTFTGTVSGSEILGGGGTLLITDTISTYDLDGIFIALTDIQNPSTGDLRLGICPISSSQFSVLTQEYTGTTWGYQGNSIVFSYNATESSNILQLDAGNGSGKVTTLCDLLVYGDMTTLGSVYVDNVQVLTNQKVVAGSVGSQITDTADSFYGAAERDMLDNLKASLNLTNTKLTNLITALETHGMIT